jgi:hypothetical protein
MRGHGLGIFEAPPASRYVVLPVARNTWQPSFPVKPAAAVVTTNELGASFGWCVK